MLVVMMVLAATPLLATAAAASSCSSDELAVYRVFLDTHWSRELFPKQYPEWRPPAGWSKLVGRTHDSSYWLFREGEMASAGLQVFAEKGHSDGLEAADHAGVYDEFTAPPVPRGVGRTVADFFLDGNHSMVSVAVRVVPSPDWFIGVDSLDLCRGNHWIDSIAIEVDPMDAGTDNGFTFTAPNWPSEPKEPVARITSKRPSHPANSFYYPKLDKLPSIATLTFVKWRLRDAFNCSTPQPPLASASTAVTEANTSFGPLGTTSSTSNSDSITTTSTSTTTTSGPMGSPMTASPAADNDTSESTPARQTSPTALTFTVAEVQEAVNGCNDTCASAAPSGSRHVRDVQERATAQAVGATTEGPTTGRPTESKTAPSGLSTVRKTTTSPTTKLAADRTTASTTKPTTGRTVASTMKSTTGRTVASTTKPTTARTRGSLPRTHATPRTTLTAPANVTDPPRRARGPTPAQRSLDHFCPSPELIPSQTPTFAQTEIDDIDDVLEERVYHLSTELSRGNASRDRDQLEANEISNELAPGLGLGDIRDSTESAIRRTSKARRSKKGSRQAKHCQVSEWSPWSACSVSCGVGDATRTRRVLEHPRRGGRPCPALQERRWCGGHSECPQNFFNW